LFRAYSVLSISLNDIVFDVGAAAITVHSVDVYSFEISVGQMVSGDQVVRCSNEDPDLLNAVESIS
jgi:hypothetical protein